MPALQPASFQPVPLPRLMQDLPRILAAPRDQTTIRQITFRPGYGQRQHPDRMRLTRDQGIPGERWATAPWLRLPDGSPDPGIQVSILPARVHDLVCAGALHPGDTIIADLNTSMENLPAGSLLRAGTATLRVSPHFNAACVKWKVRYGQDALDWITLPGHPDLRLRGLLCAVEEDGEISPGAPLTVLSRPAASARP
ncbi:MAG: hypothetical protein R3D63_16770 [Paracoccaceae bacterium]